MLGGLVVALGVPVAAFALAFLVERRIVPYDLIHDLFPTFSAILWLALGVLGPVGIVIFGWAAGARGALEWISLAIVGIPTMVMAWFVGAASLGGVLGNPF
jgi:hypothetical protein